MTEEVKGQPEKRRSLPRRLFVWLGWSVLIVLLLALGAEAALWKLGWPEFLRQLLCTRIVPAHLGTCSIQTVRGALFTDIVLEGIDVNIRQGNNLAEIRAAEAVIVPRWKQLLDGKADFEEVRISGGSAHLAEYRNGKILQEREFFLEEVNISAANSLGNTLTGEVSCTIQGVALRSEINLENALPWLTPKADKPKADKPKRTPEASSPKASREAKPFPFEKLLDFNERLKDLAMKREWTTISLSCNGDLAEPASISIDGAFSTDGGAYRDFPIPPATGDFSYSNQILSLIGVRLMLSEKECVTVNGEMNFASGTVSAQAGGDIFPASVLRFTGTDFKLPEELIFHTPVNFSVFLPECTPAQAPEMAEISFRAGHAAVAGKSLYNVEGILSGNRRRIHLLRLDADFDDQGRHTVHGGAVLDLENRLISCHVSGTADLLSITEELGGNANLKQLADNFRSTSFSFQLHPSPPELARLNLEGKIYQPEAKFAVFSMKNIEADFTLRDGIITFRKATANLASDHYSRLTATASAPVEVFSGNAEIPFEMQLEMPDTPGRPRNPYAMTANGTMTVSHQQGTLAVNSVSGHLFPEIVANLAKMHELRHLSEIPKYISCRGHEPILYRGEIPAVSMNALADMEVRLSCTLQDADLIKVPLKRGSCRTIITRHGLKFLDIDVETIQGDIGGLDIDIVFSPFSIRLTQLHLKGNPANITDFIGPLNSQELYRRIWEHCTWSQEIQPEIFIPAIVYESEEATDNGDWKLTLEGTFQAKDSYYRNCYIPEVSCRLNLELPGSGLLIDNIKAGYPGDAPLLASIALNFEDDLKGVVTIDSPPGRLNIIGMLKAAAPVLAENVSHFNLHPQTTIRCRGTFTAADKTTFRLQGTIESQEFTYRRITLNQLRGTWDLDNSRITWEVPNAGFYGGTLTSQGKYDFSQRKADMEITTSSIPLREIADAAERYRNFKSADEEPEAGTPSDIKGALDSSARLVIHSPRENQPLMLEGDGHVNITAPDLWGIPLFMPLAKLISISTLKLISRDAISSLGQISTLDTDFSLHGRDISFQNLKTDGTILALEGSGKYNIDRKEADFDINGKLLHEITVVSWLLRPFSWVFEAHLTGTDGKYEWHLHSPLHKILPHE